MPNRYRYFFLDRDDRLTRVSEKFFRRSRTKKQSAIPELAGQRARSVMAVYVYSETWNPKLDGAWSARDSTDIRARNGDN